MNKLILVIALIMSHAVLQAQCYETKQGYQTYHEKDAYGNVIRTYEVFETREVEVPCKREIMQVQRNQPQAQYQNYSYQQAQPIRNTNLNVSLGMTPNSRLWVNTLPTNQGLRWNSGFINYSDPIAAGVAAGGLNGGAGNYLWRNQWWNWPNSLLSPWINQRFIQRL